MSAQHRTHRHRGFSLIEVMVGMVIGMLAILIIAQIFRASEGNKRNTTGGDDAQINGTIALYGLERDIRVSGYGIGSYQLLGCSLAYTTSTDSAAITLSSLAPVTINPATSVIPAGDANTDTILVIYGDSDGVPEGDPLINASTSGSYPVATPSSFQVNDRLIAQASTRPSPCALTLDKVTGITGSILTVTPSVAGLATGSPIFNLGQNPVVRAYAIRNGVLTMCDYMAYNCGNSAYVTTLNSSVWVPIASNIVSLRAEYGRDDTNISTSAMTGVVTIYDQTTPGSVTSTLNLFCSVARVLSVRVAIVARNPTYDKGSPDTGLPTQSQPTWSGSTVSTGSPSNPTAVPIDLSTSNPNWQYYRYKTLETTIPLRNTIWQGSQATYQGGSGC